MYYFMDEEILVKFPSTQYLCTHFMQIYAGYNHGACLGLN